MKTHDPLDIRDLRRLKFDEPKDVPYQIEDVNICSFKLPPGAEPRIMRNWQEPGAFNIVAHLSSEQIESAYDQLVRPTPTARIPVTTLDPECLRQFGQVDAINGKRLPYAAASYLPRVSQIDFDLAERLQKYQGTSEAQAHGFSSDNRYVYQDTSFPWRTVGRVWTETGACSGCTIGPRLVLTASHCINWLNDGGAGWVKFSPAFYNGNGPWGEFYAERVISWNPVDRAIDGTDTTPDYVVLVMNDYVGNRVGYPGYRSFIESWNGLEVWQHVEYPVDLTSTQRPSFRGGCVISSTDGGQTPNGPERVMASVYPVPPGHSCGPIWGWWPGEDWPRVVGIQSADLRTTRSHPSGAYLFSGGTQLSALISWARNNYP